MVDELEELKEEDGDGDGDGGKSERLVSQVDRVELAEDDLLRVGCFCGRSYSSDLYSGALDSSSSVSYENNCSSYFSVNLGNYCTLFRSFHHSFQPRE